MSPPVLTRHATNREGMDIASEDVQKLQQLDLKSGAKIKLYQFDLSPPAWKVRALLHYYGVPYESIAAYPGQQLEGVDSKYRKIPKLVIDDMQINDSAVIFRTLGPMLSGEPLTAEQVELEKRNNIKGLLGALEKETFSSYFGIVATTSALTSDWTSWRYALFKPFAPYAAGLLFPLLRLFFTRLPHGRHGTSLEHGRVYQEALGSKSFFHGDHVGPLDLSLYGTFACFTGKFQSPHSDAVLAQCGLREWYERVDALVNAVRPLDAE